MVGLLTFAILLVVAVLFSEFARRSILSTAVLFLVAGFIAGDGMMGLIHMDPTRPVVSQLVVLALYSVLFTEGMRIDFRQLRSAWVLPGRALLLGMPLTFAIILLLARSIVQLPWVESCLLAAALSPTDPVFAEAIVGRKDVPARLRHLLNVESGINDGMTLPAVLIFLAMAAAEDGHAMVVMGEVAFGIGIGIVVPWVIIRLERMPFFSAAAVYETLLPVSIGLLVLGLCELTHANELLASFTAGITIATVRPEIRAHYHHFGEVITELLKLAAVLVFGALISPAFLGEIGVEGYLFALLVLVAVRPIGLGLALIGSRLSSREWLAAAWFGPRGFASVFYAMLIVKAELPLSDALYHLIALVIAASILAHSSTDVLIARWFSKGQVQ